MYKRCTRGAHGNGWLPLPDHQRGVALQVGLPARLPQASELDQCWHGLERFIGTLSRQSSSLGGCLNRTDYPMTMNRPCWRNSRWNWLALTRSPAGTNWFVGTITSRTPIWLGSNCAMPSPTPRAVGW